MRGGGAVQREQPGDDALGAAAGVPRVQLARHGRDLDRDVVDVGARDEPADLGQPPVGLGLAEHRLAEQVQVEPEALGAGLRDVPGEVGGVGHQVADELAQAGPGRRARPGRGRAARRSRRAAAGCGRACRRTAPRRPAGRGWRSSAAATRSSSGRATRSTNRSASSRPAGSETSAASRPVARRSASLPPSAVAAIQRSARARAAGTWSVRAVIPPCCAGRAGLSCTDAARSVRHLGYRPAMGVTLREVLDPATLALMDQLTGTMFCAKDTEGRYVAANQAFVARTGRSSVRDVVGRRAEDLFVPHLAVHYQAQDAEVLATGRPLHRTLELILRPGGVAGWYLTSKEVVRRDGVVLGLVSVSEDLRRRDADDAGRRVARAGGCPGGEPARRARAGRGHGDGGRVLGLDPRAPDARRLRALAPAVRAARRGSTARRRCSRRPTCRSPRSPTRRASTTRPCSPGPSGV